MKMTESQLRSIIKKELRNVLNEMDMDSDLASDVQREFGKHTDLFYGDLEDSLNAVNNEEFKKKVYELVNADGQEAIDLANQIVEYCKKLKSEDAVFAEDALFAYEAAFNILNKKFNYKIKLPYPPY